MIGNQAPAPKTKANKIDRRRRPERKVEILQAVISLLERRDFKVTTAALAAEVGLSEAALYRHFTGKTAIFKALTDHIEEHLLKVAEKPGKGGDSPMDHLKKMYNANLAFFAEHPGLCRVFLIEGVVPKEETEQMTRIIEDYRNSVHKLLVQGQKKRELSKNANIDAATDLYVGMLQSAALRFVMSGFKKAPTEDSGSFWKLFVRAVAPK